jgi:hypothetical protein
MSVTGDAVNILTPDRISLEDCLVAYLTNKMLVCIVSDQPRNEASFI